LLAADLALEAALRELALEGLDDALGVFPLAAAALVRRRALVRADEDVVREPTHGLSWQRVSWAASRE